jgi:prepilin-type processing-associated H-X9-DG protein
LWWQFATAEDRSDPAEIRAGSYALNFWLGGWWNLANGSWFGVFLNESDIQNPTKTPTFADAVCWTVIPQAVDSPATDLQTGCIKDEFWTGMNALTIPRHGVRPSRVSTNQPPSAILPGAINVAFYDGHVELVKLEGLWQLTWRRDYQPPTKRPGLK